MPAIKGAEFAFLNFRNPRSFSPPASLFRPWAAGCFSSDWSIQVAKQYALRRAPFLLPDNMQYILARYSSGQNGQKRIDEGGVVGSTFYPRRRSFISRGRQQFRRLFVGRVLEGVLPLPLSPKIRGGENSFVQDIPRTLLPCLNQFHRFT